MNRKFYNHLVAAESLDLLFVHRWILLCFKREFPETEAMKMWEACWAHYQTDYFHLFICSAIISIYGDDVIAQSLRADEMMVHFSSLAMHMSGDLVLRKVNALAMLLFLWYFVENSFVFIFLLMRNNSQVVQNCIYSFYFFQNFIPWLPFT